MTDYNQLSTLITSLGGNLEDFTFDLLPQPDDSACRAEFWSLPKGKSLVVIVNNQTEQVGLYCFVGDDGDDIEKDLAFVRALVGGK